MTYKAGPNTFTGKYGLGSGDRVTFYMDQPMAGGKKQVETVKINGNELEMIDADGTSARFKKVN
jgi:hypothetical protein